MKRFNADQRRRDIRAGLISATIANHAFGRDSSARVVKPTDFLGERRTLPAREVIDRFKERFKE